MYLNLLRSMGALVTSWESVALFADPVLTGIHCFDSNTTSWALFLNRVARMTYYAEDHFEGESQTLTVQFCQVKKSIVFTVHTFPSLKHTTHTTTIYTDTKWFFSHVFSIFKLPFVNCWFKEKVFLKHKCWFTYSWIPWNYSSVMHSILTQLWCLWIIYKSSSFKWFLNLAIWTWTPHRDSHAPLLSNTTHNG